MMNTVRHFTTISLHVSVGCLFCGTTVSVDWPGAMEVTIVFSNRGFGDYLIDALADNPKRI
jgi:hypothetical protein